MVVELENTPDDAKIYEETNEYIIVDNRQKIPMIVWKDKEVIRDLKVSRTMKKALQSVGEKKYGSGNFFIDRFPEGDEKYLTWYCRPNVREDFVNHNPHG